MSLRYSNGAIIKPGFNPVLVPGAPTIGAATGGFTQATVAFTAPTDTGGSAITSYQVVSSPGSIVGTGASSPITVTGLTNGTAYTFRVTAVNSYGAGTFSASSASVTPAIPVGQQAYTTAGTFTWVAPAGVTSVSVVAVGAGARSSLPANCYPAGGGGGGLGYINNYSVIGGNSYTVIVGAGTSASGGASSFVNTSTVRGGGGTSSTSPTGGTFTGAGGGNGGNSLWDTVCVGGGGAGGYAGNGGGGRTQYENGISGSGGGGGGGKSSGGGGGVGILGQGSNGAGSTTSGVRGGGGSGGAGGTSGATGGLYGGGGAGGGSNGANGAVRIIWPGDTRLFPSTNTGDL